MPLPRPLVQIDAESDQGGRNYPVDLFIRGDARLALEGLASALPAEARHRPGFGSRGEHRARGRKVRCRRSAPTTVADALRERVAAGRHPFVRDVTVCELRFGNRYVALAAPHLGVHALGGGIGQGVAMALARRSARRAQDRRAARRRGAIVDRWRASSRGQGKGRDRVRADERRGYGVIRNIQDAQYGGRAAYAALRTPDFAQAGSELGLPRRRIARVEDFAATLDEALRRCPGRGFFEGRHRGHRPVRRELAAASRPAPPRAATM